MRFTVPCHCNLHIKLIYKCFKKKKSPQEAGPQARGRKPKLSRIERENRKTQRLNSISFFFFKLLEKNNCLLIVQHTFHQVHHFQPETDEGGWGV